MPAEDETSALLRGLALVQRALERRASELRRRRGFSDVTFDLSVDGPALLGDVPGADQDEIPDARDGRRVLAGGAVEATPKGHRRCAWRFEIAKTGPEEWSLDRRVTLDPAGGEVLEAVLPLVVFGRLAEAAERLPGLVGELVATPLPAVEG
jgi:hypothetical protein